VVAQYKFDYSGVICVWLYVLGYALGDVFSGVCTQWIRQTISSQIILHVMHGIYGQYGVYQFVWLT